MIGVHYAISDSGKPTIAISANASARGSSTNSVKGISTSGVNYSSLSGGAGPLAYSVSAPAAPNSLLLISPSFNSIDFSTSACDCYPPDVMMTAGGNYIFEMVNTNGAIYNSSGALLKSEGSLQSFFGVPAGTFMSDPKVMFDNQSKRWFASIIANVKPPASNYSLYLAVSETSDPRGSWYIYRIVRDNMSASATAANVIPAGSLPDQPILGVSNDKVVLSVNEFAGGVSFSGMQYIVMNKETLVSGGSLTGNYQSEEQTNVASLHPAELITPSNDIYMVSTNFGGTSSILLATISGNVSNLSISEVNITANTISSPPTGVDPGGADIDTDDGRVLDAFWKQGNLWLSLTDGCTPSGSTTAQSCARVIELNTTANTILNDFNIGSNGYSFYYPAIRPDRFGNVFTVFGYSSSTVYPSIAAAEIYADNTIGTPFTLVTGSADNYGADGRYGDYFSAETSPFSNIGIIVAGEFVNGTSGDYWSTHITGITTYHVIPPYPVKADRGQTATLSGYAVGGILPYSYQWLASEPSNAIISADVANSLCAGATTATCSFSTNDLTAIGNYTFRLMATDSGSPSINVTSPAVNVLVESGPSVTLTPINKTLDAGQVLSFTVNIPGGGVGPFSENILYDGNVIYSTSSSGNFVFYNRTFSSNIVSRSQFTFNVVATDQGTTSPYTFNSAPYTVTINPAPYLPSGCGCSYKVYIDQGQNANIIVEQPVGGTAPYSYDWNEAGTTPVEYAFNALVGSVLNRGEILGSSAATKGLQTGNYAYPETNQIVSSPAASPYSELGNVPMTSNVVANEYGGGMSFNSFSAGIPANDNIMHITHADIKSLMQDSGLFRENESLWITGFVAANQMSSVLGEAQVEMYDAGGAYQVTFANTIQVSAVGSVISLFGENWTLTGITAPPNTLSVAGNGVVLAGGSLNLTSEDLALPAIDMNLSNGNSILGSKNWSVELLWTNATSSGKFPNELQSIIMYDSKPSLLDTGSFLAPFYLAIPAVIRPGTEGSSSFWLSSYVVDILDFVRQGSVENLTFETASLPSKEYANAGGSLTAAPEAEIFNGMQFVSAGSVSEVNDSTVQEPINLFTVSSSLPDAFNIIPSGGPSPSGPLSNVSYNLDSYQFSVYNAVQADTMANITDAGAGMVIELENNGAGVSGNYISGSNELRVGVLGYNGYGNTLDISADYNSFTYNNGNAIVRPGGGKNLFENITDITLNYSLPNPGITVNVWEAANVNQEGVPNSPANEILLGSLTYNGPKLLYKPSGYAYYASPSAIGSYVTYNGEGTPVNFTIQELNPSNRMRQQYFTYNMPEITTPGSSAFNSFVYIGITNTSTARSSDEYWINETGGMPNDLKYVSSQGNYMYSNSFITERGSEYYIYNGEGNYIKYFMARNVANVTFGITPLNLCSRGKSFSFNSLYDCNFTTSASTSPGDYYMILGAFDNATTPYSMTANSVEVIVNKYPNPSISTSGTKFDSGERILINASAGGGTSPYGYNIVIANSLNNNVINSLLVDSSSNASYATSPDYVGTLYANALITDSANSPVTANTVDSQGMTIRAGPSITTDMPQNAVLDMNDSVAYTVTLSSGGWGPFGIKLMFGSTEAASNTISGNSGGSATLDYTPKKVGALSFNVEVTDQGTTSQYFLQNSSNTIKVLPIRNSTGTLAPGNFLNISFFNANAVFSITSNEMIAVNVLVQNVTGNYGSAPSKPSYNVATLTILNYSVTANSPASVGVNIIAGYACGEDVEPYKLSGGSWSPLQYTTNSETCRIEFEGPIDPTVGLFQFTPITTTVPSGGGGGGGGGGGYNGPIVSNFTNATSRGYVLKNYTQDWIKVLKLDNSSFTLVQSYIAPYAAGIVVNNVSYDLAPGKPELVLARDGAFFYIELLSVSYLPILHTVNVALYESGTIQTSSTGVNRIINRIELPNLPYIERSVFISRNITIFSFPNSRAVISIISPVNSSGIRTLVIANVTRAAATGIGGYLPVSLLNISINGSAEYGINVTMGFPSDMPSDKVFPFEMTGAGWTGITNYTVNSTNSTVSFSINGDPVVGLFEKQISFQTTSPTTVLVTVPTIGSGAGISMKDIVIGAVAAGALFAVGMLMLYVHERRGRDGSGAEIDMSKVQTDSVEGRTVEADDKKKSDEGKETF